MSDEVSQFLQQVGRLRDQQIEEDEVRARELEEYLAAKRERQARREERARSISPQKSSPANTPSPRSSRQSVRLSESLRLDSPAPASHDERESSVEPDTMDYSSSSPTKENESPSDAEDKRADGSTPPARSSALSWQRRPTSRGGTRPLSMVAAQNATQRSLAGSQEPSSATETSFSKEQIAQALGAKDPTWFKQTPDRGQSSAAFRRSQVEDEDRLDMSSVKAQLPGMSAESSRDRTPSASSTSTSNQGKLASPLPLSPPPRFDGPAAEDTPSLDELMKSPSGRSSPTRAPSPTKGMGGFVQSAMMKRSDSVKRWSVTSPPGLKRVDSVASGRGNTGGNSRASGHARSDSTTPSPTRSTSQQGEKPLSDEATPRGPAPILIPENTTAADEKAEDATLPVSPSKTMDPRRWSPNKSSWLDSALNKPDSPKPSTKPFAPSQPAWMVELNKNKSGRPANVSGEVDRSGSASHKHQVSIGGLMRSSPMGAGAKPNSTGLGGIYSPPPGGNRPPLGHGAKPSTSRSVVTPEPSTLDESTMVDEVSIATEASSKSPEPVLSPGTDTTETTPSTSTKTKPEAPPKKDFRAALKPRAADSTAGNGGTEPEFKNVFGNLRRTKTQNYVAPDELKGNILRGKAALNITGGPQKSERKDEFKEAILKKREDFKKAQEDGKGVTRSSTSTVDKPVPEGLARRSELGTIRGNRDATNQPNTPVQPRPAASSPKPTPGPKRIASGTASSPKPEASRLPPAKSPSPESLKRVSTEPDRTESPATPRALPSLTKETSAPGKLQQGQVGGGKLADRFNPALASMLARGPPPMATEGGRSTQSTSTQSPNGGGSAEPPAAGPQLTHMTKNRARGPKRKAPKTTASAQTPMESSSTPVAPGSSQPKPSSTALPEAADRPASSIRNDRDDVKTEAKEASLAPISIQQQVAATAALRNRPTPIQTAGKSSDEFVRPLALRRQATSPERPVNDSPSPIKPQKTGGDVSQAGSPKKLDVKRMSKFLDDSSSVPSDEAVKEPVKLTHQRTGSRSPVKFGARPLPEPGSWTSSRVESNPTALASPVTKSVSSSSATKAPSPKPKPKPSFDGQASPASGRSTPAPSPKPRPLFDGPPSRPETPSSLPKTSARPLPIPPTAGPKSPPPIDSPARSPTKQASELATLLTDFFGPQRPTKESKVDPAELLMNPPKVHAKVKTLGIQMFRISGDGKKVQVPAQQERELFEQEMYVCAHEFTNDAGRKTFEVYFWVGDEVPESTAEDALLFAQREARSLGGRLIKLRQGKETSEFLQGLGGTVITRRGSSNKYDSLAPNMLCGRRYLGQVAFDEVDFATGSLCAGFPYLITHGAKCYLWKGKGSNVDELSGARLIGMDLTLTGELLEYEEGSEPASFWDIFESKTKPHSADHWRLKPNYSKYGSRLFCSDAESRQHIYEISPFSQADLTSSSIYVVDAFFEMYVIVGSHAQSQFASFRNALNFAQEYAILAASIEDRPFVPVATVVLEGAPRDLKRVFRRWSDDRSPTVMAAPAVVAAGLKRGRSLRVVSLTQALQALRE